MREASACAYPGRLTLVKVCSSPLGSWARIRIFFDFLPPVSPLDAFWHLLNFLAAAGFTGLLTAVLAKLVWRHALRNVGWQRLIAWAVVPAMLASVAGLLLTGRDGKMVSYAGMVLACAVGVWWVGFARRTLH